MSHSVKQLAFDWLPAAAPTLDNFIVGRNAEVLQRLRELPSTSAGERFVYIWGEPGSGRTHLLKAAVQLLRAAGGRVAFAQDEGDLAELDAEGIDAAAVDDVDRLGAASQARLFSVQNRLRETGGALLVAGAAPPNGLTLRADVITRIAWGLVYQVHTLSDDEKTRALSEHAAARGFALTPEVASYLLNHSTRDMRTLIGIVDSLDRHSLETKRAVSVPLVKNLLLARTPK